MKLIKIPNTTDPRFKSVWRMYNSFFPPEERRNLPQEKKVFSNSAYTLFAAYEKEKLIGFSDTWEFTDFVFLEHIAIQPNLRTKGFGTQLLQKLLQQTSKKMVLEAELPKQILTKKRIRFYQKNGFVLNTFKYIQPPYDTTKKPVPMLLMTNQHKLTKNRFMQYQTKIYRIVYNIVT